MFRESVGRYALRHLRRLGAEKWGPASALLGVNAMDNTLSWLTLSSSGCLSTARRCSSAAVGSSTTLKACRPRAASATWCYRETGQHETKAWRGTFWKAPECTASPAPGAVASAVQISPWHDLPRVWPSTNPLNGSVRSDHGTGALSDSAAWREVVCVVEIPQGSLAKLEMDKELPYNPIVQDVYKKKPGQPMRYLLYEPENGVPFHYGFVPRTFEDPSEVHQSTGCGGDADPLDVVLLDPKRLMKHPESASLRLSPRGDVATQEYLRGSVWRCRVLGVLPMIDDGETDWKVIVEPLEELNPKISRHSESGNTSTAGDGTSTSVYRDIRDVPQDVQDHLLHWFRFYKTSEKKPENTFAMGGGLQSAKFASEVVRSCAAQYDRLVYTGQGQHQGQESGFWMGSLH